MKYLNNKSDMKLHTFSTNVIYYKHKSKRKKVTNMYMIYGSGFIWIIVVMVIFWMGLISLGVFLVSRFINNETRKTSLQPLRESFVKNKVNKNESERLKTKK